MKLPKILAYNCVLDKCYWLVAVLEPQFLMQNFVIVVFSNNKYHQLEDLLQKMHTYSYSFSSVPGTRYHVINHGLACCLGGLVLAHHNVLHDELADLASHAFTPSAVQDEPLIHPCPCCIL